MGETDLQLGGGYTYQWECAILLALNYFFEPVRYNPTLFDLVSQFLGQVSEIHLEGEERESGVDLEDINLVNAGRRILIQVKAKQAEGERWRLSDSSLLKALYRFYNSRFLTEHPETTRFVFLSNRPFNPALVQVKSAIQEGILEQCNEADTLCEYLARYARQEKGKSIDKARFRQMLERTAFVEYLAVDEVKANVQAKLQAYDRQDWEQAHALLFEHFARQSTRLRGGTVTRASVKDVLGPRPKDMPFTVTVQGENLRDRELAYLDGLLKRYEYWRDHYTPLAGIAEVRAAVEDGPRLDLPMPFIPPGFEKLVEHGFGERAEVRREPVDDLTAAVAEHRRIVLLGEPGSGKTTTLWRLTYDYADAAREDGRAPLPVFVSLGGYTDAGPFDAYLARYLGPLASYLETYRASGRLILLLDGLNEMPRLGYAERVDRIREMLNRQPDETVVVTCRELDYVVKLEELQKVEVSPLDGTRIRTFLHNYLGETAGERLFWVMAGDEVRALWGTWQGAGGTWAEFWTAEAMPKIVYDQTSATLGWLWERLRREPPPLLGLARNPYMLLMTAQVYAGAGGAMPANRARLFAAFVDTLLGREEKRHPEEWIEAESQKDGLGTLAYAMQAERGRGTTAEREWAVARLCRAVPDCDAERLLYLATSATLMDADEATVRFYHHLLQEYFAAREMGRRLTAGEELSGYWPSERWWEPSGWEETSILLGGMEADASALLEGLAAVNPVVAARCLVDGGAQASELARRSVTKALMTRMVDGRVPPVARCQAGDALARLGDPRPGVGLRSDGLPDIAWCEVPPGSFIMGTRGEEIPALLEQFGGERYLYEWEVPQHKVTLASYHISKYPVTNAQYAAFVAAGGYQERRYWTGAGWRWKGDRSGPDSYGGVFDLPNHPVVLIMWYEAVAFCRWLTQELRKQGEVAPDEEVTLPSEAQWEKAARGTDGRVYPWGDLPDPDRANYDDTWVGTTSAVGCFPGGASPYGIEDLSGNVWEWCRTKWQVNYEGYQDDNDLKGRDSRVLRGGAFGNASGDIRCAYRLWYAPLIRDRHGGFRVVVAPIFTSGL